MDQFGRYYLTRRLAVGGMAEIFLATTLSIEGFEKQVVIKRMLPKCSQDKHFVAKFIDEARLSSRLNHANIVQVFDFGKEEEHYYLSIEYVNGVDLSQVSRAIRLARTNVPDGLAAYITEQMCIGLDYAHEARDQNGHLLHLVHRDVSPANILLSFEGQVKVGDFGIAHAAERLSATEPGAILGKVAYMSPEQAKGLALDRRSDLYAVGLVLYELVSGVRALPTGNVRDVIRLVQSPKLVPIEHHRPDIAPELRAIINLSLSADREGRYQSCADLADALSVYRARYQLYETNLTLARYLKKLFEKGIPEKKGADQQPQTAPLAVQSLMRAQQAAEQALDKSEILTAWHREMAEQLRPLIEQPSLWRLFELADFARNGGHPALAYQLIFLAAAKFAQNGMWLQALYAARLMVEERSQTHEIELSQPDAIEADLTFLQTLKGANNLLIRMRCLTGERLVDSVLNELFLSQSVKAAPASQESLLIENLTPQMWLTLITRSELRSARAGEFIVEAGKIPSGVSLMGRGRVMVSARSAEGEWITADTLSLSDIFGETLLYNAPSQEAVLAFDDVDYLELPAAVLQGELADFAVSLRALHQTRAAQSLLWRTMPFSLLTGKERARLTSTLQITTHAPGALIVEEGEGSDTLYFVQSGSVEASNAMTHHILNPGDYFGEVSAIRRIAQIATLTAGPEGAELITLSGSELWKILRKNPAAQKPFDTLIEQHLRDFHAV